MKGLYKQNKKTPAIKGEPPALKEMLSLSQTKKNAGNQGGIAGAEGDIKPVAD